MSETIQCPHCGEINDSGRARCINCQTPLTAYGGQLDRAPEEQRKKLAEQVARLETRPPIVAAMTLFNTLFAIFWPLAYAIGSFMSRPKTSGDNSNYLGAAFGSIGAFLVALIFVPIAIALFGLAWGTWTQKSWAWTANAAFLCAFAVLAFLRFHVNHLLGFIWLGLDGAFAYYWFKPQIKEWFGV